MFDDRIRKPVSYTHLHSDGRVADINLGILAFPFRYGHFYVSGRVVHDSRLFLGVCQRENGHHDPVSYTHLAGNSLFPTV